MALNVLIYSESEGDTMKEIHGRRRSGIKRLGQLGKGMSSSMESIITNKTAYIGENEDKKWLNETFMNIDDQMDPEDFEFTETTYEELVKKMNVFYWQRAQYVVCMFITDFARGSPGNCVDTVGSERARAGRLDIYDRDGPT